MQNHPEKARTRSGSTNRLNSIERFVGSPKRRRNVTTRVKKSLSNEPSVTWHSVVRLNSERWLEKGRRDGAEVAEKPADNTGQFPE